MRSWTNLPELFVLRVQDTLGRLESEVEHLVLVNNTSLRNKRFDNSRAGLNNVITVE